MLCGGTSVRIVCGNSYFYGMGLWNNAQTIHAVLWK
jgi:hypothetical protein